MEKGHFGRCAKLLHGGLLMSFMPTFTFELNTYSLFVRIRPDVEQKLPGVVVTIARANGADPFGLLGVRSLAAQWVLFLSR